MDFQLIESWLCEYTIISTNGKNLWKYTDLH